LRFANGMTTAIPLRTALEQAVRTLALNSDTARIEAEALLGHVLNKPRHYPYIWPERPLAVAQYRRFESLCRRRAAGEPLAYIVKRREFWSLDLEVTPATLIPRPETECLVEAALALVPLTATWQIADLGTGSGAIALAIAKERPACQVLGTDNSPGAVAVARRNAMRLGIGNVRFVEGDWFVAFGGRSCQMILSNPPYIDESDPHLGRGDLRFEPRSALVGGPDGMTEIRLIAEQAGSYLARNGRLLLEHGYDQGPQICRLLTGLGYRDVTAHRDYAGQQRLAQGVAP
jgi:release factor glutamine methyltransferase